MVNKIGTLYRLTSPSGKSYIGITSQTTMKRWWKHKNNAAHGRGSRIGSECTALYDALRKYGVASFTVETLVVSDFEYLKELEKKAIIAFDTKAPNGYNLTCGGDGALGASPTKEARKKMSDAQLNRLQNPNEMQVIKTAIAKASATKAAQWWALSEEERIVKRKEHANKLAKANRFTPEVRAKIREAQKKRVHGKWSEERRCKVVESGSSKWTDEKKAKASEKRKQEWADPVMRQKRLDGFRKAQEARRKETK